MVFILGFIPVQQCVTKQAAQEAADVATNTVGGQGFSYRVNQPDTTLLLPPVLTEISGLSPSDNPEQLLGVQDEEGRVYYISKETGNVERQIKFGGSDDYEGLELWDGEVYVVNSKGNFDIFRLDRQDKDEKKTVKTSLSSDYDVEGLGVIPGEKTLLVACKSARTKKDRNRKIFRFDPDRLQIDSLPYLVLDYLAINKLLGRPEESPIFSPSGICVHPQTGEIYIISSPAHALTVYDQRGTLQIAVELSRALHPQPEGITIDDQGVLYISNEGQSGSAKLHIYYPS